MNILFPETTSAQLITATNEIAELLHENCLKYEETRNTIYVATWTQMQEKFQSWTRVITAGFAFSTHYLHNRDYIRLIIINEENCNAANLNNEELKAILLHELGHLLNNPALEVEPNNLYCIKNKVRYSAEEHNRVVQLNSLNKEIHADSYAKQHGFAEPTLEGFIKFNALFQEDIGFRDQRVEAITNDEQYLGTVRLINRQDF